MSRSIVKQQDETSPTNLAPEKTSVVFGFDKAEKEEAAQAATTATTTTAADTTNNTHKTILMRTGAFGIFAIIVILTVVLLFKEKIAFCKDLYQLFNQILQ